LVPLIVHDRLLGSIELDSQATHEFTDEEIQMATHAALAAAQSIENAQLYAKVQRLAIHDDLTEILNRRGFLDYGAREFELSRRFERDLALIFLDVDHLKDINDNYGHTWGDVFLRSLGKLIAGSVREIDLAGRYGGDEFVILLTETSLPQAVEAAERLRERIQQASITIRSVEFQVSASLGVAYRTSQIASLSELIDSADTALYQAKAAGRNCVRVAPPG
jgi:diguanylate cyclase (GGDEF)-like protein